MKRGLTPAIPLGHPWVLHLRFWDLIVKMAMPIGFMIFICDLSLLVSYCILDHEELLFLVVKCMLKIFVKIVKLWIQTL